jgi:hypothetical protein
MPEMSSSTFPGGGSPALTGEKSGYMPGSCTGGLEDTSMANRNWASGGKIYSGHIQPVLVDCNFIVNPTDPTGVSFLKGPYVEAVYMNTSTTPAVGNPDPAAGYIYVKLADPYFRQYLGFAGGVSPVTGSNILIDGTSVMTLGVPYVISVVGNATQAQWESVGLPAGVTPKVGMPFIATSTGLTGGALTSAVKAAGKIGIQVVEAVGNTSLSVAQKVGGKGGYIILQCLAPTSSSDTTLIPTAPAAGSVVTLGFYLSNSSVLVQGE